MGHKDNLVRKKDGSYVLKHKTKKYKEGDCTECGQNKKDRPYEIIQQEITRSLPP